MKKLLCQRLRDLALTLFFTSFGLFAAIALLPGDAASVSLGTSATPETLAALRHQMGLDQVFLWRYVSWVGGIFRGDFGQSSFYGVPIGALIVERLHITLPLAFLAIAFSIVMALPLGTLSVVKPGGFWDITILALSQIAMVIPGPWVGLILILVFSLRLPVFPSGSFPGWDAGILQGLKSLVLPALTLALPQTGVLIRVVRTAFLDVMPQPFMRAAQAKGLGSMALLMRHGFPNALLPMLTIIALQFSFLMAGAVIVERIFVLPGLGDLAYQALVNRDVAVLQSVILLFTIFVVMVNFLADLAHVLIDPRLQGSS